MTGYPTARIGDFCRTGSGSTPSRSQLERYYEAGAIPWVKSGELREGIVVETEEHITDAALKETSVKLVPAGAILLAMYGATVGRLAILGVEATTNQAVCHIVPDADSADTRYLYRAIAGQVPAIIAMGVGGAQPNISQALIKDLRVPLPPLPEQRRIAAILDQADALRAKRREALEQLDSLVQSIFIELFGVSLLSLKRTPLRDLVEEFRYGTSEKSGHSGFPALRIPNVANGHLSLSELKTVPVEAAEFKRLQLKSGDLLFVRTNGNPENVGRCAVFEPSLVEGSGFNPAKFIYASYLIRARLKARTVSPVVLQQFLHVGEGRHALRAVCKTSAGQYNINTEGLGAIPIPILPIAPQEAFAARIRAVDSLRTIQRAALAELDALFASLQHRAFTGQLL